ncbi:hypothetical protein D3C87_1823220 [compost metagenome]
MGKRRWSHRERANSGRELFVIKVRAKGSGPARMSEHGPRLGVGPEASTVRRQPAVQVRLLDPRQGGPIDARGPVGRHRINLVAAVPLGRHARAFPHGLC